MSVAFTKEPNENQVETLPDRDLGTDPNIVTPAGLARIEAEAARLETELQAARRRADHVAVATHLRDLKYWSARRATAEVAEPDPASELVQFGHRVTIERPGGSRQTFHIVGIDEADPAQGRISYLAPIARALMGREEGDTVRAGPSEAEIVEIAV